MDLQTAWFLLIGILLVGFAILDGFDLGVGMLHLFVSRNDQDRRHVLNSIAPVWDGNEVWLLTAGGAIFAAFPKVYATVFSGFYLAMMLVLAGLIVRAVAMEFRGKSENEAWRRTWDVLFSVSSFLPSLLFGVAIGNVMRGVPLDAQGEYAGTFFTLLNPFALLVGVMSVLMFLIQGGTWLNMRTEGALRFRARNVALVSSFALVALWIAVTIYSKSTAPHLWEAFSRPAAWLIPLVFVLSTCLLPLVLTKWLPIVAFLLSSLSIASLVGILGMSLYPFMVPALNDHTLSLTIYNASSSPLTLKVMLVIALIGMPVVIGYTAFIYSRFAGPVVLDEHSY